ncbi:uncharacterized protein LOC128724097 [Anopheles nili]|uniref:uncharacterized protein LOC128724097 n=1 Tax=Anopheles nili TaxID=185578 RepID=UPI00237B14EB|nr:uncharacterized protein LOC128724097 [Anopheles nili]
MSTLRSNSFIWSYFKKDPNAKRGKCLHCNQVISLEKSSYSNLKRHLQRKHPFLERPKGVNCSAGSRIVWKHFTREVGKKAKCKHCFKIISCQNATFNLRRHLINIHPGVSLEDDNAHEGHHQEEERLYDDPLSSFDAGSYSKSCKSPASSNESDVDIDSKHSLIELQPIDNIELTEPIRIEIIDLNPESKSSVDDGQEIIEETIHQSDSVPMMNYERISTAHSDINQAEDMSNVIEETITETNNVAHNIQMNVERSQRSCNFLSIGMKDINVKTAAYATNIALELESLDTRQRIVAEKLISDVLFHAKLENLTEYSMVLVKVDTFEKHC